MNRQDHDESPLSDALRDGLHGLRRDAMPTRDLWPGIASRIDAGTVAVAVAVASVQPRAPASHHGRRRRRFVAWAAAASVALALGVVWQMHPTPSESAHRGGVFASEAEHMTSEYRAAWQILDAQRRPGVDASALQQIDRSAAEVRAALRQDPNARFLFERLQSLYARRLDLAQRMASDRLT